MGRFVALGASIFMILIYILLYFIIGFLITRVHPNADLKTVGIVYLIVVAIVYIYSNCHKDVLLEQYKDKIDRM